MSCDLTKSLQESVTNIPRLLNSKEWQSHLKKCPDCFQEAKSFDKSLELYLQLENTESSRLPEIQIWEKINQKIKSPVRPLPLNQWSKYLAAAVVVLLVGISLWWQSSSSTSPEIVTLSLPTHYSVQEIAMDKPFGPPSAETRFIWTKQRFSISIQDTAKGNYSKISIRMSLSQDYAYSPNFKPMDISSGLAYLPPRKKHFISHLR